MAVPTEFGKPPPGYVPGLGRGAVGFTTRSDIGPARASAPDAAAATAGKESDLSETSYDEFSGYSEGLFNTGAYDEDDKEADIVYQQIDQRMDSKRAIRREKLEQKNAEEYRKSRPRIQEFFRPWKRKLEEVTEEEWTAISEPLDYSRQNKLATQKKARFTPVPDNVINSTMGPGHTTQLDSKQQQYGGLETPLGLMTPISGPADLTQLGRAKNKLLSVKLDRMADSVSGQTVVDPKGYLTDLNSVGSNVDASISDTKKARLLTRSVIRTNPKYAPGWIAAARLEQETGKLASMRAIIMKACEMCPTSEDVWLEATKMHPPGQARAILADAIRRLPSSVTLWIEAFTLEDHIEEKKAVLRRALEINPREVKLWKIAVELEAPDDARVMLSRAVELIPHNVDLWLALARLETYENARSVLNKARREIPTEPSIWITAAKLEEANGNAGNVISLITKAVSSLSGYSVVIDRVNWIKFAEECEKSGSVATCQAIIKCTIGMGLEDQDRRATWSDDAEQCLARQSLETARAIYAHMLSIFPEKEAIWIQAAKLEKQYGTREAMDSLLKKAVHYCPTDTTLWLMGAKEKWLAGDVVGARDILNAAFLANPDSEEVWLAAVKVETQNQDFERARGLLAKARERASTPRVWMKSAKLERLLRSPDEHKLLEHALTLYPQYPRLWIMLAQHHTKKADFEQARGSYKKGVRNCPTAISIWLCSAKFETEQKNFSKARAILEAGRLKNPANDQLYLASIRLEREAKNLGAAQQLMAKGFQECPTSGILWAHAIATDPRPARRTRSFDALDKCERNPHVCVAVAKLFWLDRKLKKARNWFNRAVLFDPNLGDAWVYFYKFEQCLGKKATVTALEKRVDEADPHHGELWTRVSKDDANEGAKAIIILKKAAEFIDSNDIFSLD